MEGRVGIGFRAKRPGVRGAKWRLADPRPKPRPFRSAGGVSVRSRHPVRHASVALSPAHALPICFQKGLGAGWGVEGVRGRESLPRVDKAPPFSTVVTACRGFKGSLFSARGSHKSGIGHGAASLGGLEGAAIRCRGHQCSQ